MRANIKSFRNSRCTKGVLFREKSQNKVNKRSDYIFVTNWFLLTLSDYLWLCFSRYCTGSGYKDSLVIAWLWGFLFLVGCTKGVLFCEKSQRKVKNIAAPKIIINFAKSFKIYCGKLRRTSIPKWMSAFFELYRGEILMREANCSYIHSKMNLKWKKEHMV